MKVYIGLFFFVFAVMIFAQNQLQTLASPRKSVFVPPPESIKYLHFGYAQTMADSLWVRAIQDFDYCETTEAAQTTSEDGLIDPKTSGHKKELEGELSHLLKQVSDLNKDVKVCKNGWVAHMLDAVTELDPKFKIVYLMGGTSLSVALNDFEGASKLFEKGVKQFPNDWRLPYYAAYHFMFDRKDLKRAAELLEMAAQAGAPPWVNSLAARAYTASGQGELAIRTLMAFREFTKGPMRKEVDQRIELIRKNLLQAQ